MKKSIKKLALNKDVVTTLNSNASSHIKGGGESYFCPSTPNNGCPVFTATRLCLGGGAASKR